MIKSKHKIQAGSLLIAGILLWWAPVITHKTAMIVSSVIIGINVIMELFG